MAKRIQHALSEVEIHILASDDASPAERLRNLFLAGHPIIGICSTGILIRSLAPILKDKKHEPPVIAIAQDGRTVIPLLGGHQGANDLAQRIAQSLDATLAITTASDLCLGIDFENPPAGWCLADARPIKPVIAAVLKGHKICLEGSLPWLENAQIPVDSTAQWCIRATVKTQPYHDHTLIYHPALLALGVGCERDTDSEELCTLIHTSLKDAGLATQSIALVCSIDIKASEPAIHTLAEMLNVPARFFPATRLEQETSRLVTPSHVVFNAVGCYGVAEGAALAAAGPDSYLVVAKQRSAHATCAIAQALHPIDPMNTGTPQGRLTIIGIGPGHQIWRSQQASHALKAATDFVGYGLYLDLVDSAGMSAGMTAIRHEFALGQEIDRARYALNLAASGRSVALISSGDPGIYAMAAVVFELLDHEAQPAWQLIDISICPGISAMQAVAARVGAPLGHDFCVISLSDLLTPWHVVEQRLSAAAQGDFIVALYNPISQRRTWQLAKAKEILLLHRRPQTPVVIGRNLGRSDERLCIIRLDELDGSNIDMLTLILIGNSQTRLVANRTEKPWVYTPRGYEKKVVNKTLDKSRVKG